MEPVVSVIVPVFKVEDCIEHCLDSLCSQNLQNIEILLVDDASPDRCGQICEQFAMKDRRIKVFHHPVNRGLSAARNTGIAHANGEYLMFVDSDDWVSDDFCKSAYKCAVRKNADLVIFAFQRIGYSDIFNLTKYKHHSNVSEGYKSRMEALSFNAVTTIAWNKLYNKKLFDTVSYPEGYYYEDMGTTYKLIWKAEKIYYMDKVLYYHRYRKNSITSLKTEKAMDDWLSMSMQQYHDFSVWGYPAKQLDRKLKNIALSYCIRKKADAADPAYISFLKLLQSKDTVPSDFTKERKILFLLLKYCPPLFELTCTLLNRKIC